MIHVVTQGNSILIDVKVVPGASRDRFMGEIDGRMKLSVSAPPEHGKANKAVEHLMATMFHVRPKDVTVIKGLTSRLKKVAVVGVTVEEALDLLQSP